MAALRHTLLLIFVISIVLMLIVGYALATMTIRPIERALSSQRMLVSNVSHELRTPLASIIGELDLALQHPRSPEDYQHRIQAALGDAHRMSGIIVGLLNMARAEYDQSQIKVEPIRIDELLMEVREGLLRANPSFRITISYDDSLVDARQIVFVVAQMRDVEFRDITSESLPPFVSFPLYSSQNPYSGPISLTSIPDFWTLAG